MWAVQVLNTLTSDLLRRGVLAKLSHSSIFRIHNLHHISNCVTTGKIIEALLIVLPRICELREKRCLQNVEAIPQFNCEHLGPKISEHLSLYEVICHSFNAVTTRDSRVLGEKGKKKKSEYALGRNWTPSSSHAGWSWKDYWVEATTAIYKSFLPSLLSYIGELRKNGGPMKWSHPTLEVNIERSDPRISEHLSTAWGQTGVVSISWQWPREIVEYLVRGAKKKRKRKHMPQTMPSGGFEPPFLISATLDQHHSESTTTVHEGFLHLLPS